MGKIPRFIEKHSIGKIWLQPFYESLHRISLRGMNYMQSQSIQYSGETFAMKYANSKRSSEVVLFDVGANIGDYSESLCKEFKLDFKLYAFEPSKKLYCLLQNNFRENPRVSVKGIGFSDTDKTLTLYNSGDLYGTVYPICRDTGASETIELETVDGFCEANGILKIFYLKIDVEGAEIDVLKGAKNLINSGSIQFIQFEFGPNSLEARICMKDFFEILQNYRIYRILKDGLRPIDKYHEILEIPLTSNFLAEMK